MKLGAEDDAYDALALILPEITDARRRLRGQHADGGDGFADASLLALPVDGGEPAALPGGELSRVNQALPSVTLHTDGVLAEVSPAGSCRS